MARAGHLRQEIEKAGGASGNECDARTSGRRSMPNLAGRSILAITVGKVKRRAVLYFELADFVAPADCPPFEAGEQPYSRTKPRVGNVIERDLPSLVTQPTARMTPFSTATSSNCLPDPRPDVSGVLLLNHLPRTDHSCGPRRTTPQSTASLSQAAGIFGGGIANNHRSIRTDQDPPTT